MNKIVTPLKIYPDRLLSYSSLKAFEKSPASYLKYCSKPYEDSYSFANLLDAYLCDKKAFEKKYVSDADKPNPAKTYRDKENKEWKDGMLAQGKIVYPVEEDNKLSKILDMLSNDNFILDMLTNGKQQCYGEYEHPETGLKLHGYADIIKGSIGMDLKNNPANPSWVNRQIFKERWHLQGAIYKRFFNLSEYFILVVEDEWNYGTYRLTQEALAHGSMLLDNLLDRFLDCLNTGMFQDSYNALTPTGYFDVELPHYLKD